MNAHHAYLRKIGLLPAQIKAWNSQQLELFKKGEVFIETGLNEELKKWYLYLSDDIVLKQAFRDNRNFISLFSSDYSAKSDNFEIPLLNLKISESAGYVFPAAQFIFQRQEAWDEIIDAMIYWKRYSLSHFFEGITTEKHLGPTTILWNYWKTYCFNLTKFRSKKGWYGEILNVRIEECGIFTQLFVLLFQAAEHHYNLFSKQEFKKNLQKSEDSVRQFFKENLTYINNYMDNPSVEFALKVNLINEGAKHERSIKKSTSSNIEKSTFFQKIINFSKANNEAEKISPLIANSIYPLNALDTLTLICTPLLEWKKINDRYIPSWNIYNEHDTGLKYYRLKSKENRHLAERKELSQRGSKLNKIYSLKDLEKFNQKTKTFEFEDLEAKWKHDLKQAERNIELHKRFRIIRMKEFGIINNTDTEYTEKKNIWLSEMLQIEDEIGPYLPFVKEAFKSALPIRKKIVYDAARTVEDGVEFDPLTVFDQEKWLRGQVMKSMKQETSLGEIEQINCFCLDFSGSMYHEKMRNLFKVLYLLVLALEDRRSYDAFHFFSNRFIKGIDFSDYHTNKKVLFQILKVISKIRFGDLKYEGLDGTNMSSGIKGCIERLQNFNKSFEDGKSKKNVVLSLFVISDGRPSMGIVDLPKLNEYIDNQRVLTGISIKGIFIKEHADSPDFISEIFGAENCVETDSFENGVHRFVKILTETYKKQRKEFRWQKKMDLLNGKSKFDSNTNY